MNDAGEEEIRKSEGEKVRPFNKRWWITRNVHDFIVGDIFSKQSVLKNLPFLIYVAILAIIYIANTYYAEKTFKKIEKTRNELKELRFQFITTKATLMYYGKQTEIAKRVNKFGLKETTVPPYKIFYAKDTVKMNND
jgi:hypothetical protein